MLLLLPLLLLLLLLLLLPLLILHYCWSCSVFFLAFDKKGYTPPQNTFKKGGHCFSPTATSMFSVKSTPNQNLQRLSC